MKTICTIVVLSSLILHPSSFAVKTERWEFNTADAFLRGKLQNLSVSSEGELVPGYGLKKVGEFAKQIWCSAVGADGTIFIGTSAPADVQAIGADGKAMHLFATESVAVTALALDGKGNLYAATMPEGKIFRITTGAKPEGKVFCQVASPYVWALAFDKAGNLFAGTGPGGKIYRITPDGTTAEWFKAEDSNILCVAFDGTGALLAGGSDRGQLYRVKGQNDGTVLHQFEEDEVHSLLVQGDRLFVGVNKQKVKRPRLPLGGMPHPSAAEVEELRKEFGAEATGLQSRGQLIPPEVRLGNLLAGALYLRQADGRVDQWATWEKESIAALGLDATGQVLVATAGQGRVYRVADSQRWELLFDFEEQQALTLASRAGKLAFVGTGNVGVGYLISAEPAATGEYTSEVLDARFLTSWGNISWLGGRRVSIVTRSGNTGLPDATWSAWSAPATESPTKVTSPRARYLQVRATTGQLQSLRVYYQVQNQKPDITSLRVDGEEKTPPKRPKSKRPDAKDDGDDADDDKDDTPAKTFAPKKASTTKQIKWQATDKDDDKLVYRLYYRAEGDETWIAIPLTKPLTKTSYSWETDSIPDGWYRLKVVASDEEANPVGDALTDEKVSDLVKVDNRRPDVTGLKFADGILTGQAHDNLSLIAALEYSVDGDDWKSFAPTSGIFDNQTEAFAVKIPDLKPGGHTIAVRATDEEGNIGAEKIAVKP